MAELGERFQPLLEQAAAGNAAAFAELWRACHPSLLRYLRVVAGDAAEDVASETWLRAMRGMGTFVGPERGFRGWLAAIGRNVTRDLYRQAVRRPETLSPDIESPRESAPDAADEALERLGTQRALQLLSTLPPAQAEMVALRVVVGLEPAEIAPIVGKSAGAVRVAVHRALATLAQRLTEERRGVTATTREALIRRDG